MFIRRCLGLVLLFVLSAAGAAPVEHRVTISSIPSVDATLYFTLTDGGGPSNTATIDGLSILGFSIISSTATGGASGGLPGFLTLVDSEFYAEYGLALQPVDTGTSLSFNLSFTNLGPDPGSDPPSFPDGFALYLLDADFNSVLPSSDPTGAQALLTIDGGGSVNLYSGSVSLAPLTPASVAEPGTITITALALGALWFVRRRASRSSRAALSAVLLALSATLPAQAAFHFGSEKDLARPDLPYLGQNYSSLTWAEGVMTPERLWAYATVYPYSMTIDWGDGTPLTHTFYYYNNQGTYPNYQFIKNSRYIVNLVECRFSAKDCLITGRHVYQCPVGTIGPTCEFTMTIGISFAAAPGDTVEGGSKQSFVRIPVKIIRSDKTASFNVYSAGDSIASGEGNPLYFSRHCNVSFPFLTYSCDGSKGTEIWATFERIFDHGNLDSTSGISSWDADQTDASRSIYAGPAVASSRLLNRFLDTRLPLRVGFYMKSWSGATVDKSGTRTITSMMFDAGRSNNFIEPYRYHADGTASREYDVVTLTAGANNIPLSELLKKCGGASCKDIAWGDGKTIEQHVHDEINLLRTVGFQKIAEQISLNPAISKARVFVTGYFDFEESLRCTHVTAADSQKFIVDVVRSLNDAVREAATRFNWTYVDVNFEGHGMCEPAGRKWVANLADSDAAQGNPAGYFHPNMAGHQEYGHRLYDAILPLALDKAHCVLPPAPAGLRMIPGALRRNFGAGANAWSQEYTIANDTGLVVNGPVVVVLNDMPGAIRMEKTAGGTCPALTNAYAGRYYVKVPLAGPLNVGETAKGVIHFNAARAVSYRPVVLNAGQ